MQRTPFLFIGLAIFLVGCGSAPPSVPLSPSVSLHGTWRSLHTLAYTLEDDDTSSEPQEYRVLQRHLTVTDAVWTERSVVQTPLGALEGLETTAPYRAQGDSIQILSNGDASFWRPVAVRNDTLTTQGEGLHNASEVPWVRAEPLSVPPELLGVWVGLSPPDAAGVSAELGFRFRTDGIYENGWGEAEGRFFVLGSYLLLDESPLPSDVIVEGSGITVFTTLHLEIQADGLGPDRLLLTADPRSIEPPFVLYRR
ncbi:MAG: hypothetical protein AAF170_15425 [Bacteroidota bacterium]